MLFRSVANSVLLRICVNWGENCSWRPRPERRDDRIIRSCRAHRLGVELLDGLGVDWLDWLRDIGWHCHTRGPSGDHRCLRGVDRCGRPDRAVGRCSHIHRRIGAQGISWYHLSYRTCFYPVRARGHVVLRLRNNSVRLVSGRLDWVVSASQG